MTDTITVTSAGFYEPRGGRGPILCRTFHLTRVTPSGAAQASITVGRGARAYSATRTGSPLPEAAAALLTLVEHTAQICGKLHVVPTDNPDSTVNTLTQDKAYAPYVHQDTP